MWGISYQLVQLGDGVRAVIRQMIRDEVEHIVVARADGGLNRRAQACDPDT